MIFFILIFLLSYNLFAQDIGGAGTSGDPYILYNAADVDSIRHLGLDKYYILGNDINLGSYADWTPIGDLSVNFTGDFNGKGFTIDSLTITSTTAYQGLFGYGTGCTLGNVKFTNASITNTTGLGYAAYMGVLAGLLQGSSVVDSCFVEDSQVNMTTVGGVYKVSAGGLIGSMNGTVTYSYCRNVDVYISSSTGTSQSNVGGFVGTGGTIEQCYYTGDVYYSRGASGAIYVSLFIGGTSAVAIDCYARGTVNTTDVSGSDINGFIRAGVALRCYSVSSRDEYSLATLNGFINTANNVNDTTSCFDSLYLGTSLDNQGGGAYPPNAFSTSDMKTESTFTDEGWDLTTVWGIDPFINDGYPYLRLLPPPGDNPRFRGFHK